VNLDFDFAATKSIHFGVLLDEGEVHVCYRMEVDAPVKAALREMAITTLGVMDSFKNGPAAYDPGQKYGSPDYVVLAASADWARGAVELNDAQNIPTNARGLSEPENVIAYFARFRDRDDRRLAAVRRATQFKGVLKNHLVTIVSNALKMVPDQVFKLDHDFDYLVDSLNVHIIRPSSFEFVHGLQSAILEAAPRNVTALQGDLPFVDLSSIAAFAGAHPRAARYLASICSLKETKNIDVGALRAQCADTGVSLSEVGGKLIVDPGQEIAFLEVLDRRRYSVELALNEREAYRASSRDKIQP
jgi:hypothetical protein